ncbi:MAG: peptidylprolyl isomerase [Hungatella sp.]|jgi:foldase protein PrsA|nr:peptidylprolyl isomerase [Hungatella sp.]
MKRKNRWRAWGILALTLAALLGGCSKETVVEEEAQEPEAYTRSQMMVIAVTERNRYEQVYTDKIWDAVMENGDTFEQYLLDQVRVFLENMKTMTLLAQESQITISSGEADRVRRVARNYYSSLTRKEIEYLGISEADVVTLYEDYHMAGKVVEVLTDGLDLEVSDSEAKVITIKQVETGDRLKAEAVHERMAQEGSDFSAVARDVTGASPQEKKLWRGQVSEALEEAAFALAAGEISPVVEADGMFYVIQCVNDYEMDATRERKTQIYKERKNWAFQQIYEKFAADHSVAISDEAWSEVTFEGGDQVLTSSFFQLYQEEFGSQGY